MPTPGFGFPVGCVVRGFALSVRNVGFLSVIKGLQPDDLRQT